MADPFRFGRGFVIDTVGTSGSLSEMFGRSPKVKDRRMMATSTIVAGTVVGLGLSIPIVGFSGSDILPLLLVAGSAIATASVWIFGKPVDPEGASQKQVAEMEKTIADLRERLESVEVLSRFESSLADSPMGTEANAKTMVGDAVSESESESESE